MAPRLCMLEDLRPTLRARPEPRKKRRGATDLTDLARPRCPKSITNSQWANAGSTPHVPRRTSG